MENELADYIFNYCSSFFNEVERRAFRHSFGQQKISEQSSDSWKKMIEEKFSATDESALALLKDGIPQFVYNTAKRIFEERGNELKLNLCPKCKKIARTPTAIQCRFCGHDWH